MSFLSFLRRLRSQLHGGSSRRFRRRPGRSRPARPGLENLEDRTLLAVLPAAQVDPNSQVSLGGNNTPSIARDPIDPQKLVVVSSNVGGLRGAFSLNGGADWNSFTVGGQLLDPNSPANAPFNYAQATTPSVAFDRNGSFFVVHTQHDAARTSGALVFEKFDFTGESPDEDTFAQRILYQWVGADPVLNPVVGIDTNLRTFTDPDTGAIQTDPFSNRTIFVAWNTNNTAPTGNLAITNFNPNTIKLIASDDGGQNWSSQVYVNDGAGDPNRGGERDAYPQFLFPQGTADGRVPGGQFTMLWDNVAGNSVRIDNNDGAGQPAAAAEFRDTNPSAVFRGTGTPVFPLAPGTGPGGSFIGDPAAASGSPAVETTFAIPVKITNPNFNLLDDLNVQVSGAWPHNDQVRLVLRSPGGQEVTLVRNRKDTANADIGNPPQGLPSGANLGVINGRDVGTVFDQQVPRSIVDSSAGAAYTSYFRPETGGLDFGGLNLFNGFHLEKSGATDTEYINGTWYLRVTDFFNSNENPKPPQDLRSWGLTFTSQLSTTQFGGDSVAETGLTPGAITSPFPSTLEVPNVGSGRGIGPGLSVAVDNTLGSFSPFQGRMYMVYTVQ